jgi:hypothetical protein
MGRDQPRENVETRRAEDPPRIERRDPEPIPPALASSPDYEVLREISRGGMGIVYLARNRRMDRLEGLKVVSAALLERAGALERFEREMRAAARLNHPNIVTAYSSPPLEGLLAFAMEYVDGVDLHQLVRARGPLPVSNACYYIHQAAKGLQHAHERGMVHRDIKPNNLMLTIDGKKQVVKILDFGLAKANSENPIDGGLTGEGQVLGTPHYMAPEQISHASKADIRADIYSLGCTLYFLLTGDPPFRDKESVFEILTAHHRETPKPVNEERADIPKELAEIVAKMMAKETVNRYPDPAVVMQALAPYFKAGIKAIPAGSGRFSTPAAGPPAPETASSKATDATRMPARGPGATASPSPADPAAAIPAGEEVIPADLQRALESPGAAGYVPATARVGKSDGWLSALRSNPRIAGVAAGSSLLVLLALWAGGAFDGRRELADRGKKGVAKIDSDRKTAADDRADRELAATDPDHEMPDEDGDASNGPSRHDDAQAAQAELPAEDKSAGTETKPADTGTGAAPTPTPISTGTGSGREGTTPPISAGPTSEELAVQPEVLKSVRNKYTVDVRNAERALAAQFDVQIDALVKARLRPDERVHMSEALKAEKAAFESNKLIPWSRPMRLAVLTYLKELMAADAAIQKAYGRHIAGAIKAKDDAALDALRIELRTAAPRRLLGTWNCTGVNFNGTWTWKLFSDGTFQRGNVAPAPGDEFHWLLDGSLLYLKAISAKDPKVQHNNRCTIAVDGGSFTGENNRDQRFAGTIDRTAR